MLKPGGKVVMTDNYYVREEYRGKVWTVRSRPWKCGSNEVVLLEGYTGGYAVDGLRPVTGGCDGDACDITHLLR